ncbi:MAG: hypothetical protein VW715_02165 [Rhodospirillales bacterium]
MSIAEGATSAISMFQAMQRNRMARDELEYQRQQDALARADRLAGRRLDEAYRRDVLAGQEATRALAERTYNEAAPFRAQNLRKTTAEADRAEVQAKSELLTYDTQVNTNLIDGWASQNLVNSNDFTQLDKPRLAQGILNGDKTSVDLILSQATSQLDIPVGSKAVGLDRLPNGNYVVRVQNGDGSMGVVTGPDGSSAPDAKPAQFTAERLASLAEVGYQLGTLAASKYDPMLFRQLQNKIGLDADAAEIDAALSSAAYGSQVVKSLPAEAQRPAMSVIAAAETVEERAEVIDAIAQDAGMPPQAQALLEQRRQVQEKGKLGGNQERTTARIAEIDAELAELGFNSSGARTEAANLVAATESASAEELSQAIESGQIAVTPEVTKLTADMLRGKGIEELQQLKRLNNTERSLALAVMAASTTDATTQRALLDNIDNIMETGSPSMSRKDSISARQTDEQIAQAEGRLAQSEARLRIDMAKFRRELSKDGQARTDGMVDGLQEIRKTTETMFFDENGKFRDPWSGSAPIADKWAKTVLPDLQAQLSKIELGRDGQPVNPDQIAEYQALRAAITQGVGLSLAAYANNFDWFTSIGVLPVPNLGDILNLRGWLPFDRGEADQSAVSTDFIGDRIELVTADGSINGRPKTFYYLDVRGNRTDRGVDASEIEANLGKEMYTWMVDAGRRRLSRTAEEGK